MKTTILFITLFILIASNETLISQPQKRLRELTIREEINQYFETYYSGMYEVADIVDIDSLRGDKKYFYASIQNPYGMLTNSFVFVTRFRDDYDGDEEGNRTGIYKEGNMIWLSNAELPSGSLVRIFAIDDINLDGTVEIITEWDTGTISLWIQSWNGTSGNLLNSQPIIGAEFAMGFVDVEGDGIWEIRNLSYYDGSEVWSWNGSEYGQWPNTPIAPLTELYPANNFIPHVKCIVSKQGESFTYNYTVENDAQSKQRIELFWVVAEVDEEDLIKETPPYWESSGYSNNLEGWQTPVLNNGYLIWLGNSQTGFKFITHGLPAISPFKTQANNSLPDYDSLTQQEAIEIMLTDLSENMVWGETIGPREPDDILNFEGFLDTLIGYTQRSFELDWITNKITADKYDSLFTTAKTLLKGNHIPWVDSTLHTVLEEVNEDSSGNITSEAYALLRYNTEYLLENLPEVIPPVLNKISPQIILRYVSGGTPPDGLTVTVAGANFSDSSVAYFKGSAKATTIVSDTVLTFPITGTEMSALGNFQIWISTYGINSDTVTLRVVNNLMTMLLFKPTLQCVQNNGGGSYTAYFGYVNDNGVSIYVPIGSKNKFPKTIDRGQPKLFLPGTHTNVFSVNFNGKDLTWTLDVTSVTANKNSTPCP